MAATKYSYAISTGTLNGKVDSQKLKKEIDDSSIVTGLDHIETNSDNLDVWMKASLSAPDQTTLTVLVNNHDGVPLTPPAQTVIVQEEEQGQTQGHYQACSHTLTVDHAINTWKESDLSFPYPISIFSASFVCKAHHESDIVEVVVAPDTIIGAITSNVSASDTVINVQQSVIDNIQKGYHVKLYDGVNQDDLGEVLSVDDVNNTITVQTGAVNSFLSSSPTYIQQTIYFAKALELPSAYRMKLGEDVIGGSLLPANTVMRIRYKNVEGTTTNKKFSFIMEYKY